VLTLRGLSVDYGTGLHAVHAVSGVDLVLHRGEILGLAGESGSGKSTLAHAVTRLLRPPAVITEGTVIFTLPSEVAGSPAPEIDILSLGADELRAFRWEHLSIVFQGAMNSLNPVLDVETQLVDTLRAHLPGIARAAARSRAADLLQMVRVSPTRLGSFPHELSGGMRQRVMLAMALALNPDVVVMDEPTTALDVVVQREVLEEVLRLRDQFTLSIIFITHDLSLPLELADTIAIMYAGRIVEHASTSELSARPSHPYTQGLLDSFPQLRGPRRKLTGITGLPPDPRQLPPGCPFHPRCNRAFEPCSTTLPTLIEIGEQDHEVACWLHEPKGAAEERTDTKGRANGG